MSLTGKIFKLKTVFLITALIINHFAAKAQDKNTVYIFLSETCPICKSATLELNKLNNEYSQLGYEFVGIFPNENVSNETTRNSFSKKYKLQFPLIADTNQQYKQRFNAKITPEVIVWNETKQKVIYRGKIDNSFESIGKRRTITTAFYLRNALESIQKNDSESITFTEPVGCFIQTKNKEHEN
jgi:peroxiredoxin